MGDSSMERIETLHFIPIRIKLQFTLTITFEQIDRMINRAINEGIGDWAIITKATRRKVRPKGLKDIERNSTQQITQASNSTQKHLKYTIPIQIEDITTNKKYVLHFPGIMKGIQEGLIDFTYALDTTAGYNLLIEKLTREDIDEIIQIAIFGDITYKFIG